MVGVVVGATVVASKLAPETSPPGSRVAVQTSAPQSETISKSKPPSRQEPEKAVRWRMAGAFASSLPQLGTLAKRLDEHVWQVSGDGIEIKFHGLGTLVPTLEMLDAVASGAVEAAFSSPSFWSDHAPALQIFAAVPFGPSAAASRCSIRFTTATASTVSRVDFSHPRLRVGFARKSTLSITWWA